ncbi:hypothetical protein SAMN05878437_1736 [Vreelandella subglaciescola]|jgi:hypothetical protein|uniref:Uncharacterized protein n=1 Tax=Vreelandella subglaciescola TaxID=29571 RepID=A0A1M7GVL6_9GAMM|nr:hypothetical protein SAMN05878437_1736 [Halomonas subglaciescola]
MSPDDHQQVIDELQAILDDTVTRQREHTQQMLGQ